MSAEPMPIDREEFERRLNAGEIEIDDSPDVTRVAMMLPLHATHK